MMPERGEGLWVQVDYVPEGAYVPVITYGADHTWRLEHPAEYAAAVAGVVITAQHDAAVVRLCRDRLGAPLETAGELLRTLRGATAREPVEVLPGMTMTPGVNQAVEPFVIVRVEGAEGCQIDPPALLEHATGALCAARAAELDAKLRKVAMEALEIEEPRALAMVESLAEHWPGRG